MLSKLPQTGTTIFSVMSALAAEHRAINLSQGFPNFPCDPVLIDLVYKAMKDGYNQYPPMPGILPLREVIAHKTNKLFGSQIGPDQITVTAGATQAIYTAITAVVHPGDEVIIFTPAYDCYAPAIELNGGKTVAIQLEGPEYQIDLNKLKSAITPKTRMVMINSPHNPTGQLITQETLNGIADLLRDTDIILLSDEVYEHIVFDGEQHASVLAHEELAARSFVVSSFGKTFHATGWKMGYCVAPNHLMTEFRKCHQFIVFTCHTPTQYALAEYMQDENTYLNLGGFYQQKRDFFLDCLRGSAFKVLPSKGTYFQLLDYSALSNLNDVDYARELTIKHKVASIPVSVFNSEPRNDRYLRFCFAKDDDTLRKAAEILKNLQP